MFEMKLYEKNVATEAQIETLKELLKSHGFSVNNRKYNIDSDTYKVASTGATKEKSKSGKGTLISVWNTNKATDKAYNVRISNDLHNTLSAISDAVKIHLSNATYKDSDELCIKFFDINDVINFFDTLFAYINTAQQTKSAIKESETKTA